MSEPWNLTEAQRRQVREAHAAAKAAGFPLAEPLPPPVMVTRPCGCTSMDTGDDGPPVQVSWCDEHDPGYDTIG